MVRRGKPSAGEARFLDARIGLFWLAALVWLTGLLLELPFTTGAAIALLVVALLLGFIARRASPGQNEAADEEGRHP